MLQNFTKGAQINVSALNKSFLHGTEELSVLCDVNLRISSGERVAIVGESGVGKSTLLHLLGTLDVPTSGTILFNDENITTMKSTRLSLFRNKEIGFVFQFHHLLPDFTALENVMMPGLIAGLDRTSLCKDAEELLDWVNLRHRMTHKPGEMSGGEQQRVALARALIMRPSLLLADEPTGNLDAQTGKEIQKLIVKMNQELNITVLVVTHSKTLADQMPRCLTMTNGTLV